MNVPNLNDVAKANQMPINQAAAIFLKKTDWGISETNSNVVDLMLWGLDHGIRMPTISEAGDWILRLEMQRGPVGFTNLVIGADDGQENLSPEQLKTETDPLDAAGMLLDNLVLNYKAGM